MINIGALAPWGQMYEDSSQMALFMFAAFLCFVCLQLDTAFILIKHSTTTSAELYNAHNRSFPNNIAIMTACPSFPFFSMALCQSKQCICKALFEC